MSILEFVLFLAVAGIVGCIGQALAGYSRGGCLVSIALGFVGALLGFWLARLLGLPGIFVVQIGGQPFPVVWSILGAALLVAILGARSRSGRRRPRDGA
ncbi:MAG TPA: GlsB/YeaQ/YmgE family stress response membrane protein [Planctomycetota bacterium]|nr:GlsB/YeaQ/YmgE family stress response membrane protein [Planctomycetota bacterium]